MEIKHVYKAEDFPLADPLASGLVELAVIGYPVKHSASPKMHQAALNKDGKNISYVRVEIEPGNVAADLDKLRAAGFLGVNATVPHKFDALDYCTELTDSAKLLGTVNTIKFTDTGAIGHNTDGPGFANAIEDSFEKTLRSLSVCIVGAGGGAGTAIAKQCAQEGCSRIVLINRSVEKLKALKSSLAEISPGTEVLTLPIDSSDLTEAAKSCNLIVNTTSLGLKETDPSPLPPDTFSPDHLVYDTIYNPPKTRLLRDAEAAGAKIENGLSLLLHQGALSYELWFGNTPDLASMREAISA